MERVALGILGFVIGAFAGFIATIAVVWLWFDVLGMTGPETGPKPGLDWLFVLGPVLALTMGGLGAWLFASLDPRGRSAWAFWLIGLIGVALIAWFFVMALGLA